MPSYPELIATIWDILMGWCETIKTELITVFFLNAVSFVLLIKKAKSIYSQCLKNKNENLGHTFRSSKQNTKMPSVSQW